MGSLPAGPIAVAVGAEYRRDSISINPDPQIAAGNIVGLGASFADGSKRIVGLRRNRIADLAFCRSHDGRPVRPLLGFWQQHQSEIRNQVETTERLGHPLELFDQFRAPTLSQTSRSSIRSFQAVNDPIRCPVTNTDDDCGRRASISAQIVFNPNIEAETSSSRNVGLVWDVTRDFNLSMDYFDIRRKTKSTGFRPISGQRLVQRRPAICTVRVSRPKPAHLDSGRTKFRPGHWRRSCLAEFGQDANYRD